MIQRGKWESVRRGAFILTAVVLASAVMAGALDGAARAQAPGSSPALPGPSPAAKPATPATATPATATPATPGSAVAPSATPPAESPTPVPSVPPAGTTPPATQGQTPPPANGKTPLGADTPPSKTQIEPNAAPGIPDNATTENVTVAPRDIAMVGGQSSYDDAFKSIKASIDTVKAAMTKAGLAPSGHPVTIFSEPNENGFKYSVGIPLAAKPATSDIGNGVTIGMSPGGKAIKFQHRGAYDDIDSTYDVITAYLDAKGLQVGNPYIEEYLTDLKTPDDPNLQVDIYTFVK